MATSEKADIGLIGLAVMGQNLILNMNDHGFKVVAFNRTVSKVDSFIANEAKGTQVIGAHSLEEFVSKLKTPRIVMMLVQAGKPVDDLITQLLPLLSPGDIVIDGGNSEFKDSIRRCKDIKEKGFLYVGCGVSGGEDGARHGPSLMPGGTHEAWPHIKHIFQSIAAKTEINLEPCCDWVGCEGAGHFVKMVHNGIEYGDMQLIAEAYHVMKSMIGLTPHEMSEVFKEWNKSELDSYLIEITADILNFKDKDGDYLVEKIRDTAGQKGTGKWTAITALEFGSPLTLIAESVFARCVSALQSERQVAGQHLHGPSKKPSAEDNKTLIDHVRKALYASKIVSYAQGYMLMRQASLHYKWNLNYGNIALMWRGGCIIRSRFLNNIKEAFDHDPNLTNLLTDPFFAKQLNDCQESWRLVVCKAIQAGVPCPAFSSALAFFDSYRCTELPCNLIQAQRDYFGAHQYELANSPGVYRHTNWTGHGGNTASSTYLV